MDMNEALLERAIADRRKALNELADCKEANAIMRKAAVAKGPPGQVTDGPTSGLRTTTTTDTGKSPAPQSYAALVDGARIVADYLDTLLTAESMGMSSILRHGIKEASE